MNANTITLTMSVIKRSMEYALSEGVIQRNPASALIRPLTGDSVEKDSFTEEQTERLFKAAQRHPDGILIYILYYFGLRIGEALGLKWGDFNWEKNMVHIERQVELAAKKDCAITSLKTKKSDRHIGIPVQIRDYLYERRELPNVYVIHQENGDPLTKSKQRHIWIELMLDAGFAHLKKEYIEDRNAAIALGIEPPEPRIDKDYDVDITPHWFRHNYSTMLFEGGVELPTAMEMLGHSDIKTTVNVYTHVKSKILQKAAIKLDSVFKTKNASFPSIDSGCNLVAKNKLSEDSKTGEK
jgi:integrase